MLVGVGVSVGVDVSVGVGVLVSVGAGVSVGVGVAGQGIVLIDATAVLLSRCQTRAAPLELTLKTI